MIGRDFLRNQVVTPVTRENFSEYWQRAASLRRGAMRRSLIRKAVDLLVQIVFYLVFMVLALGAFYEMGGALIRDYVEQVPEAAALWNAVADGLFVGAEGEGQRILRCAMLLYIPPVVLSLVIFLLVYLFYHPITPKRTMDEKQDAWQLQAMAIHVKAYAARKGGKSEFFFAMFVGVTMAALVLGLMLYANARPELHAQAQQAARDANILCLKYGLILYGCYRILYLPLKCFLWLLLRTRIPEELIRSTEAYHAQLED